MVADGRLDLCHRAGRINRHHDLLGSEQVQDRPGLLVIVPQAALDRLGCVIGPDNQLAATHVTDPSHGRAGGDQVVVNSALGAQAPAEDALFDHLVGDLEEHRVQVVALQEEAGLGLVAGKPSMMKP
jgi:hypothetical protein